MLRRGEIEIDEEAMQKIPSEVVINILSYVSVYINHHIEMFGRFKAGFTRAPYVIFPNVRSASIVVGAVYKYNKRLVDNNFIVDMFECNSLTNKRITFMPWYQNLMTFRKIKLCGGIYSALPDIDYPVLEELTIDKLDDLFMHGTFHKLKKLTIIVTDRSDNDEDHVLNSVIYNPEKVELVTNSKNIAMRLGLMEHYITKYRSKKT